VSDRDRSIDSAGPTGSGGSSRLEPAGPAAPGRSALSSSSSPARPSSSPALADPTTPRLRPPEIELEDVTFDYPDGTRALDGIDLRIEAGRRVAIVGQNGSGKSTLARHLNGLLRPTRGRMLFDGADVRRVHVASLAARVGLAFQNPDRQLFSGKVAAEVAFGPRNLGVRGEELERRVTAALEAVGLGGESGTNPYDLGYSRRKLLAIASVLAMRTPVLVLDEPTTGQDARGVARVRAVVAGAAAEGRTVIAVSHDMRFVAESFERVLVLRAGRLVLDGAPEVVFAAGSWAELRSTYLEPPFAAVVGERLGLGSTPTEASLIAALAGSRGSGR
jgi:energy-coupling factor transporter ATP-binding protein EcfA2